ncbi:MAG TPA: hypothetical protein VE988_13020 [Gemmataceae bacterium]|nr:hypothetical protein [Gemmataceae bacterium]
MADKHKNPQKPNGPKGKGDDKTEPFLNLEIPGPGKKPLPDPDEELMEVVEVVDDDDIPVVEDAVAVEDVEEVEEVVEVIEDEPIMVEEEEHPPQKTSTPANARGKAPAGKHESAPKAFDDDDLDELAAAALGETQVPATRLTHKPAEHVDLGADEPLDEVEVLPSDSNILDAPLVEEVVEVEEATEVVEEVAEVAEAEEPSDMFRTIPHVPTTEDESLEVTEPASAVDLGKDPKMRLGEGSDIIIEALESGVDVGEDKSSKKPSAAKAAPESDIDINDILSEIPETAAIESSAVDLGSSGEQRALSGSDIARGGRPASDRKKHQEATADDEDAVEVISEDALIDAATPEMVSGDDDEVLVAPKKKSSKVDVVDEVSEVVEVAEPTPAPKRKKPKDDEELVGAGAGGGRRGGGFMPFLFGGILATLALAGAGAAAWYFGVVPESPTAEKPKTASGQPIVKANTEDFDKLKKEKAKSDAKYVALKTALDDAKLPVEPDKLQAQLDAMIAAEKAAAEKQLAEIHGALKEAGVKGEDVKQLVKLAAAAGELNKKLDTVSKERDAAVIASDTAVKSVDALNKSNDALSKKLEALTSDVTAVAKERDALKIEVDVAKKEAEQARLSSQSPLGSSISSMLGAFGGFTKMPTDIAKKAFDTTKLSAELAAAKAKNVTTGSEPPERKLDLIVMVLANREFNDPKELDNFQRVVDSVLAKDSKANAESRAKALYAAGLIQRNQGKFAEARKIMEAAAKEAQGVKEGSPLHVAASKNVQELADPAAYYMPRVERCITDGQYKQALEEIIAALKVLPDHPQLNAEAFYVAGRLDELKGEWAKAEQNYRQALKLMSEGPAADRYRVALAQVLLRGGGALPNEEEEQECALDDDDVLPTAVAAPLVQPTGDDLKKLEESIKIAQDLISRSTDKKTQGEGYMLLGAAQARMGQSTEGLKNFVKGLKMAHPDWSTEELERIIVSHPAFQQPDVGTAQPNPVMSEKHYGLGLDLFWAKKYADAEAEFAKAIAFYDEDARYRYFLGMSRYMQGTATKRKQADFDFSRGAQLESSRHPTTGEVNASLERVQGDLRKVLNGYREKQ